MQRPVLLDPAAMTDAELGEVFALLRRCKQAAAPDEPYYTVGELVAMERRQSATTTSWGWVAEGGLALLTSRLGETHADAELVVAPEARRRGIGTALAEAVLAQARETGCHRVVGRFADESGAAFARSLGARIENSVLISCLDLPPAAASAVKPLPVPGYSIRCWVDEPPSDLVESWAESMNAADDAPHSEGIEQAPITVREVREILERTRVRDRQMWVTAVLDARGEVVGSTYLVVGNGKGADARTGDTSVVAEHRRRGLARWLKAESLARLVADRPDVPIVRTSNDVTNVGMLAVNHAVGFRTVATYTQAIVDLSDE